MKDIKQIVAKKLLIFRSGCRHVGLQHSNPQAVSFGVGETSLARVWVDDTVALATCELSFSCLVPLT